MGIQVRVEMSGEDSKTSAEERWGTKFPGMGFPGWENVPTPCRSILYQEPRVPVGYQGPRDPAGYEGSCRIRGTLPDTRDPAGYEGSCRIRGILPDTRDPAGYKGPRDPAGYQGSLGGVWYHVPNNVPNELVPNTALEQHRQRARR